jgi:hypothetical protein
VSVIEVEESQKKKKKSAMHHIYALQMEEGYDPLLKRGWQQ